MFNGHKFGCQSKAICIARIKKRLILMDNKLKEALLTVALTTVSVLIALRINTMLNSWKTVPPRKAEV
jgi:hypothetical protein